MHRARRLAAATTLAAALLPAAAHAGDMASVARERGVSAGPVFTGDGLAWAVDGPTDGAGDRLRVMLGGTKPVTRFTAPPLGGNDSSYTVALEGSQTRLAWAYGKYHAADPDGDVVYQRAVAGAPGGPLAPLAGTADGTTQVTALDVAGDRVVTAESTANGSVVDAVRAYDLAAATPPTLLATKAALVRTAGPYVAYRSDAGSSQSNARIVVADAATGTTVYTVDVPTISPYGYGFGFDLQADGTLAILAANPTGTGGSPVFDLAWASPAAPTVHVVATDVETYALRVANGVALFSRQGANRYVRLYAADLATGTTRAVTPPSNSIPGVDFDGNRLAWSTQTCVYAGTLPTTEPTTAPPGACAGQDFTLGGARSTNRSARALVTCNFGTATGCAGTTRLTRAGGGPTLATGTFSAKAAGSSSVVLPIRASVLRALARSAKRKRTRQVALRITASAKDAAGNVNTQTNTALVTVR